MIKTGEIINFTQYRDMKEEEKKRRKRVSYLTNKSNCIVGILNSIDECIGASFITKYIGEMNQVVRKEHILDEDLLGVVINALAEHDKQINNEIEKLNNCNKK